MADWKKILTRGNVDDRRSATPIAGGLTIGGVVLILAFNYLTGGDLSTALQDITETAVNSNQVQTQPLDPNDTYKEYASTVLGSDNDVWKQEFQKMNRTYEEPTLVLFRVATDSGCGGADSRLGPHYCPIDKTIYLDETFFDILTKQLNAKGGDVAQAYVISHEVGHHVQNLLGTTERVQNANSEEERNQASISLELQADCFAGIWAHSLKDLEIFEEGEISEAMDAAAAVGDDRIQAKMEGHVNPETWTHGSSEQRVKWFMNGYNNGSVEACNTF